MIRQGIGTVRGRDVDLNHHEVRRIVRIVEVQPIDVLVLQIHLVLSVEIPGEP